MGQPGVSAQQQPSTWLIPIVVILVILIILGLIAALTFVDMGITDMKTGKLSVTISNYDIEDRDVSIYVDGEHSTDEVVPAGFQWTGLIELRWTSADPIKEISVLSGAGTQTKQVQMVEGSIVSVSFDLN